MEHKPWCNSILDDESDYEYLYDAGDCTCGSNKEGVMEISVIKLNEFWTLKHWAPRYYSATRNDGEHRVYWSREALELDFGKVQFPNEVQPVMNAYR